MISETIANMVSCHGRCVLQQCFIRTPIAVRVCGLDPSPLTQPSYHNTSVVGSFIRSIQYGKHTVVFVSFANGALADPLGVRLVSEMPTPIFWIKTGAVHL